MWRRRRATSQLWVMPSRRAKRRSISRHLIGSGRSSGPPVLRRCFASIRVGRALVQEPLRRIAQQGAALQAADYVEALDKVTRIRAQLAEAFTRYDLILTPCFAALPWTAEATHPETIDGKPVGPRGHAVFTAFANAGGLPGISIPCRPAGSGLPIAMQLVGPTAPKSCC